MSEPECLIRIEGCVGHITLNRPKALNALTYSMSLEIEATLRAWAGDPAVDMVMVDGAGDKAFCAGGDIQDLYRKGRAGDFAFGQRFWADEYRLNALIANYPKPYVALMDGFVMGGGVGVSAHGTHRVVTERTQLAMPECGIGLIPDVGGSWLLAHAQGHIGDYVGLTGVRLRAADAIYAGLADGYVPSEKMTAARDALLSSATPEVLADFWDTPTEGRLPGVRTDIDRVFGQPDLSATLGELARLSGEWAETTEGALRRASPISLACAFELIRTARQAECIEDALAAEYRFASRCMEHGDFLEGIRASVVDKDRTPHWRHARVEDIGPDEVAFMLSPADGGDLNLRG